MKQVSSDSFLKIPLEEVENKEFDFCMCNPPFFVNEFEASHGIARSEKRPQPSGVCTGTETETVTGGGEVEFVKEIIKDSLTMKEKIRYNHFFFLLGLFLELCFVINIRSVKHHPGSFVLPQVVFLHRYSYSFLVLFSCHINCNGYVALPLVLEVIFVCIIVLLWSQLWSLNSPCLHSFIRSILHGFMS